LLLAAAASYKVRSHEAIAEAVKFGRLDLAEVCCSSDSKLTQQVLALGGTAERYSDWNGYNLVSRKGAQLLRDEIL